MTREEILRQRLPELIATMPPMPPLRKPKPAPEVRAPLVGKIAEAAKANPASVEVRVSARAEDGTTVIDRPRQRECARAGHRTGNVSALACSAYRLRDGRSVHSRLQQRLLAGRGRRQRL